MPTPRNEVFRRRTTVGILATLALLSATLLVRSASTSDAKPPPPATTEGKACWYDVPKNSKTKQRAGPGELTAAHKSLPNGTRLRVTNLKNNKSIQVRIIDRLKSHDAIIDLSRESAEKLDMIHDGSARVRLEVLPDNLKTSTKW
jgi:rare lipoprotein A